MDIPGILGSYGLLPSWSMGTSVKILCPFHAEDTPSCQVDLAEGHFYCFGCEARGGIVDLVSQIEGVDNFEACKRIVRNNLHGAPQIEPQQIEASPEEQRRDAYTFFSTLDKPSWDTISNNYMIERGFDQRTLEHFDVRINQSSAYPIIIPIKEQSKFKGYVCRRKDADEPKYLNSKGLSRKSTLFGHISKGRVLVAEGVFDMMAAWQYGYENVCSTLGWHTKPLQAKKLAKYASVVICALDNDTKGEEGFQHLRSILQVPVVRFPFPPWAKDIREMSQSEFAESIRQCVELTRIALLGE